MTEVETARYQMSCFIWNWLGIWRSSWRTDHPPAQGFHFGEDAGFDIPHAEQAYVMRPRKWERTSRPNHL